MKQYLLGIDIGTSACKTAVFDEDGHVLATGSGDYPVYYPAAHRCSKFYFGPDDRWKNGGGI